VTVNKSYELQFADGMNFYNYCRNNPITFRDPSGLTVLAIPPPIAATAVIGLAILFSGSLIDQIAQVTGSIAGYQAASSLFAADIDAGFAVGVALQTSVAAGTYLTVSAQSTALTAASVGTTIVATGASPLFDLAVFSTEEAVRAILGLVIAQATVAEALDEFRKKGDFYEWAHREYKGRGGGVIVPGPGVNNPNMTPEEILDAYELWRELGRPSVRGPRR